MAVGKYVVALGGSVIALAEEVDLIIFALWRRSMAEVSAGEVGSTRCGGGSGRRHQHRKCRRGRQITAYYCATWRSLI